MKKLLILLILTTGLFAAGIVAQPSFSFFPEGNIEANAGDQICVPVNTLDFTQLIEINFSVNWDPTILQFASIQNLNGTMLNLDLSDFDFSASLTNNGMLTFDWDSDDNLDCNDMPTVPSETLDDDETLFEICFDVMGIYGGYSEIKITDDPLNTYVTRLNANCNNIGLLLQSSCTSVSVGYTPVTFNASSASGQMGETVCVDISIEDFSNIQSMQFTINFDQNEVTFISVESFNLAPEVNFGESNSGDGYITVSWFDLFNPNGTTLADGTTIIELCFELSGDGGNVSPFTISDEPVPIEVVDTTSPTINPMDPNLQPIVNGGTISIDNFNPNGITLNMQDQEVCIGEEFCIDITVEDFFEIRELGFSLNWNSNVLNFEGIENFNNNFPNNIGFPQNFTTNMVNSGKLGFHWESSSILSHETLNDGEILFSICFTVVGSGGSSSVVSITNDPEPIVVVSKDSSPADIGMNTNSALVDVKPTQGITVIAGSGSGFPGDEICIDFEVADFDDITRVMFSMNWNGTGEVLEYSHVIFGDLPDLEQFNFLAQFTASSSLGFEWEPFGDPVNRPNGTVIFSVCFDIVGDPGECTAITIDETPFAIDIQTATSNGINVGMNGQPGEVCVENTAEYIVSVSDNFGAQGATTCVDISVENFNQMTQNNYSITWDILELEYQSVQPTGNLLSFDNTSFDDDINFTEDGELVINWMADNQIQGESVSDGTVIYEVCFTILGEPGGCSGVAIGGEPEPIVVMTAPTGNSNLGLTANNGSVCVTDVLSISNINITGVDCLGENSGGINFNVMGGSGIYQFFWEGPGINGGNENDFPLEMVVDGTYSVTITDEGGISYEDTFIVGVSANAPVADAGEDFTPDCDQNEILLDGTGSVGNGLTYLWTGINSNCTAGIMPGTQTSPTPQVLGNCTYILTITESTSNCMVSDTVIVFAQTTAVPDGGSDLEVTCLVDTVIIEALYLQNPNVMAEWMAISGTIYASTDTTATVGAGEYVISLVASGGGCVGSDTILVVDNTMPPMADAGENGALGCSDVSVQLDASASTSNSGGTLEFLWSATGNGGVCSDATLPQIDACGPGEYTVLITDTGNGCTATGLVMVMGDTLKPVSNPGVDMVLTCLNSTAILDGSGSSMGMEFEYSWIFNGMEIGSDIQQSVMTAGTYTLMVTNTENMCSAVSLVVVTEDIAEPMITLSAVAGFLSCNNATDTLTVSTNIPNAEFAWSAPVTTTDSVAVVDIPTTYSVTVTNIINGCTNAATFTIEDNTMNPGITTGPDQAFSCGTGEEVTLLGEINPAIPNAIIQWSGGVGCFVTNPTDLQPVVSCAGEYILTVQNPISGCISMDTVMVTGDATVPEIADVFTENITCLNMCADLSFTLVDPLMEADLTIEWFLNATLLPDETGTSVEVCESGLYEIVITHNASSCTDSALVQVEGNIDEPTATAGTDATVDCDNPTATLDATTSLITGETTVQWCDSDGMSIGAIDETIVEVGGGIYILKVTNIANGCTATDEVEVISDGDFPTANAGSDVEKGCNDATVTLDGSMSDAGDYQWTDELGNPVMNGTNNTVEVALEGIYTLTVTNPATGCSASDNAIVIFDIDLPDADAMADSEECSTEGILMANLPTDATGLWTSLNAGTITDAMAEETMVTDLTAGENCFIWTLSSGTCTNYSADTVCVNTSSAVISAINDAATTQDSFSLDINVLVNDDTGTGNITFNVLTTPTTGTVDSFNMDGTVYYTPTTGFEGDVSIDYEICSLDCPGVCDTATLTIAVTLAPATIVAEIPNGITPNGDGVNDALVFDILVQNPEEFPSNEIIIFNRWGDIIYKRQPYFNDWNGVHGNGDDLPEGTYYYILRLDFGKSQIIRGDVTIVR
jgi:gliding motility-associated-like protein